MRRDARQFEAAGFYALQGTTNERGSPSVRFSTPGGGDLQAETIERRGEPTYLQLSRCND
jgi:hypothetical protein